MGFESLLGNAQLKENLVSSLKKGRISHFYLISGPEGAGKRTLAKLLAAAILCRGSGKPCFSCAPCRKVMEGNHPDFITVDDPEKKTVPVELIRQARADMYVQPNESDHKIYLFPRAQDMGVPGQNALLKILEEPPKYGVFILLTDNPERLLPTVRSRCTELALRAVPSDILWKALEKEFPQADEQSLAAAIARSGGFVGQARQLLSGEAELLPQTEGFIQGFAEKDTLTLAKTLAGMEKWKRDQLITALTQWEELLENALAYRSGMPAVSPQARLLGTQRNPRELMQAVVDLQKGIEYAQGNVSPAAICGWLTWALR